MNVNHNEIILHLSLIEGIGPVTIHALMEQLPGAALYQLYTMNHSDFMQLGLNARISDLLYNGLSNTKLFEEEKKLLHQHAIDYITIVDQNYPELLKQIYMPPAMLYTWGRPLQKEEHCVALVGSRQASFYAKHVVDSVVPELVSRNWTIVSGGALGADTFAHKAALMSKGKTIAILGSGFLHLYPYQNKTLFHDIMHQGGTLVSSFAVRMEPLPGNFPARNRIMAGMAQGCLVLQAKKKSGARITAQFALEQGREVFAVPGLVTDPLSYGCHELIKEGAHLVNNAGDILAQLGSHGTSAAKGDNSCVEDAAPQLNISVIQELILMHCVNPMSVEELLAITQLSLADLQNELFSLHIEGLIKQHFNGLWQVM